MREREMGELVVERRTETEKREREIYRKREGGVKLMCLNCIPTMNMNTLWKYVVWTAAVPKYTPKLIMNMCTTQFWQQKVNT